MTVRDVKKAKQHLLEVVLDNGETLLLDKTICAENGISKGKFLDSRQTRELCRASEYARAKSRALWYLDRKDYSEKALYNKLVSAGFGSEASGETVERLKRLGLIDDLRFAESLAERCERECLSERHTLHKLLEKGIAYNTAKEVVAKTEVDEETRIYGVIEKKYLSKLALPGGYEKVYAALIRKGFSYARTTSALKKYIRENCEEY